MSIKQAIEALEELVEYAEEAGFDWSLDNARAALAALRSMPAEPLGYMNAGHVYELQQKRINYAYVYPNKEVGASVAIYATPHTEAVRMSEAEIDAIYREVWSTITHAKRLSAFARAVEQATFARLGVKMGDV